MASQKIWKPLDHSMIGNDFNGSGVVFEYICEPIYVGGARKVTALYEVHSIGDNFIDASGVLNTSYSRAYFHGAPNLNANTIWHAISPDAAYPDPAIPAWQPDQAIFKYVRFDSFQSAPSGTQDSLLYPWFRPEILIFRTNNTGSAVINASLTIIADYD